MFLEGDREGQVIAPADLKAGAEPVLAWPWDPNRKVPRDGSRLNQVLLIRLDGTGLEGPEKERAADGIVAFSAICTHQACTVANWMEHERHFKCPCHQSEFDPAQDGRNVFGPAPRPLPALPLRIVEDRLEAAGEFSARVGGMIGNA